MRWTICYGFMTTCLFSVLGYSVYSAACPAPSPFARPLDQAFGFAGEPAPVIIQRRQPASESQTSQVNEAAELVADQAPALAAGATRSDVVALLGNPNSVDQLGGNNTRWNYGSHIVLFKDDKVSGAIKLDEGQALRSAWTSFRAQTAQAPERPAVAKRGGSMMAKSGSRQAKYNARRAVRSRSAYGATGSTVWESMFRPFFSDKPLPRNKSHIITRNNPTRAPWVNDRYRGKEPMFIRR